MKLEKWFKAYCILSKWSATIYIRVVDRPYAIDFYISKYLAALANYVYEKKVRPTAIKEGMIKKFKDILPSD